MERLWHLTLVATGRGTIFRTEEGLRCAVRTLAETAGARMLLFSIVDDHVHVVVCCDRKQAGRIARSISLALRPTTDVPIRRGTDVRSIESRSHLQSLVRYHLTQLPHHGVSADPALWTGSCFQDLIGARRVGVLGLSLHTFLPRFRIEEAMAVVGLPTAPLVPAADRLVRALGAARLVAAAGAALAVGPSLAGRGSPLVTARAAASQLAATAGISTIDLADAMGTRLRNVQRGTQAEVEDGVLLAVRLRMALEQAVEEARSKAPRRVPESSGLTTSGS